MTFLAVIRRRSAVVLTGPDAVLVAQVRPFDALIHEVGPGGLPSCGAAAPQWHAITAAQARALHLTRCECCPGGGTA